MAIQFNQIPGNIRVPFIRIEVNSGQAPYESISRLLLIGQMVTAGTSAANQPVLVTGGEDGLFGTGSMLAQMYKLARQAAPFQEIWALPLADAAGATKAAGSLAITGAAPVAAPGSLVVYVDGNRISVPVDTTMSQAAISAAIIAAINSCPGMIATAAVGTLGVAASATATVTGPATAAGFASVVVNGQIFQVAVGATDTAATVATNLAALIAGTGGFRVTATAVGAVVTIKSMSSGLAQNAWTTSSAVTATGIAIAVTSMTGGTNQVVSVTANNAGTNGNGIGLYTQLAQDDGGFADQMLTISAMANGVGDPSIVAGLANLGDDLWDFVAMPWKQTSYLDEMDAWASTRWGPISQTYGTYATAAVNNTAGQVTAFNSVRNGPFGASIDMYHSPQSAASICAAYAAQLAQHLQDAPEMSRPLQTVPLVGIRGPKLVSDRWSTVQRQSFYYAGAGGYIVDKSGNVMIDRAVTFYQRDTWGNPDQSFLDVNTLAQLMYGLRYIMSYITQTYPRAALVTSNPGRNQGFVTVQDIANAMVHAYSALCDLGVFQDVETFQQLLVVEQNSQDPSRVDTYLPVEAVNGLRVLAINATSFLQFPTTA